MKHKNFALSLLVLFITLSACKESSKSALYSSSTMSEAMADTNDITSQFIRTARLYGKVDDVVKSSQQIERLTKNLGGFITSSSLQRNVIKTENKEISADSIIELTEYSIRNHFMIRIPHEVMDSTITGIAGLLKQLDQSQMKVDDASLQMLALHMENQRMHKAAVKIATATRQQSKKLKESEKGIQSQWQWQQQADEAALQKYALDEKVEYSTLEVDIYQRDVVVVEKVAIMPNIDAYGFSLGHRFYLAFLGSWDMIIELLLAIVQWWFPIMIGIVVYLILRKGKYHFPRHANG